MCDVQHEFKYIYLNGMKYANPKELYVDMARELIGNDDKVTKLHVIT